MSSITDAKGPEGLGPGRPTAPAGDGAASPPDTPLDGPSRVPPSVRVDHLPAGDGATAPAEDAAPPTPTIEDLTLLDAIRAPTRKAPSGAVKRARRKEALEASLRGSGLDALAKPPSDPALALEYGRTVLLAALGEVAEARGLDRVRRWRAAKELVSALGLTFSRAEQEGRLRLIEEKIAVRRQPRAVKMNVICSGAGAVVPDGSALEVECPACAHVVPVQADGRIAAHDKFTGEIRHQKVPLRRGGVS
jgi:hypothetical protein